MEQTRVSGFLVTIGTEEEARKMIGSHSEPWEGELEVNLPMIRYYCSSVQDGNSSYWDEDFAQRQWGGFISPPAMLFSWLLPLGWHPYPTAELEPMAMKVPLPGSSPINISSDTEFLQPVRVGDRLSFIEQLLDISPEKTNPLGVGHFITTVGEYRNQHDELVARETNILFRFTPHSDQEGAAQ